MRHVLLALLWLLGFTIPGEAKPFVCPERGGAVTVGQESAAGTLDPSGDPSGAPSGDPSGAHSGAAPSGDLSGALSGDPLDGASGAARDILMNALESLMTRDRANRPILDLADSVTEAQDRLSYTFTLRRGVVFHDGAPLTSADVAASFARRARINGLPDIQGWDTPDPATFVVRLNAPAPLFLETLSSFALPLFILPAAQGGIPAGQVKVPVGTGPFRVTAFAPGGPVTLTRHAAYRPNEAFADADGFGGRKLACLDSVTFRSIPDPAARTAALRAGEIQIVDDLPVKALASLGKTSGVVVLAARDWSLQIVLPNAALAPTDSAVFRRALRAALDMDEIMGAASDGQYSLNGGLQYPGQAGYAEAAKDTYNIHDTALARRLLTQAGYGGEPVILLANKEPPAIYNAALATQQQLQAIGVNAQMKIVDWRTSARMADAHAGVWHLFFTRWTLQPALGAYDTIRLLAEPGARRRPDGVPDDPDLLAAWRDMARDPSPTGRDVAFARAQALVLDKVYVIPLGALTKLQAARGNVRGFSPFRVPRLWNVWLAP